MLRKNVNFNFLFCLLMISLFWGFGCNFNLSNLFPEQKMDPIPPSIPNRIISQDFENRIIWHKDHINIRRGFFPSPGMLAGYGHIAYVNFIGGSLSIINQLDVLDTNTGTTLWQSEPFPTHEGIAISKDRAFVLLNRGNPLNIYDINGDGKPLQSFKYFDEPTKFYLFPSIVQENIYIYYIQGNGFLIHTVDSTGKEITSPRKIPAFNSLSTLFLFDQPFFLSTGQGYHWGHFETGEELWHIPATGRVDSWPILRDNMLIISAGDGKRYALTAVESKSGRELWKTEQVFGSNVIFHKDSLYTLRNDAVLVKLDFTTGQIQEEVPFTPPSIDAGSWAYWLVSDGERLFVYFGDSQELFALETP